MTCVHLKKLYQFCQDESVKIGGADLLRIVCEQCGVQDECPSMLMEHLEANDSESSDSVSPEVNSGQE